MAPDRPAPDRGSSSGRRLWRSTSDRYLGGVAGGISERLAIDPALVRLALVAATLYLAYADGRGAHPFILVPYAVLWACLPTTSDRSVIARLRDRESLRELVLVVATLGAALLLLSRPSSIIVLGLGGLAVILLRDRPEPAATSGEQVGRGDGSSSDWSLRGLVPRRPVDRLRRSRPEPPLWPLTLGALVVIGVVALAIDQATDGHVDPRIVIDLALLAVGAVLTLSAWRGRARVTLIPLVILLPLWAALSVPDIGRFAGQGSLTVRPTRLPAATSSDGTPRLGYELGYGNLDIDLRALPLAAGGTIDVEAELTAGRVTISVPADARVVVDGTIGLGLVEVDAPIHYRSDSDPALNRHLNRSYPALGTECDDASVPDDELVALAARAGIGEIEPGPGGTPSPSAIAAAIGDAGYRQPTVQYTEPITHVDAYGNPLPSTSMAGATTTVVSFWNVQLSRGEYSLCRPVPPPTAPATVRIEPTIGLGTLEIHRA